MLPGPFPCLVISPTAAAGAAAGAIGMEACVLVQWHIVWGMGSAEDVAATAAMVPSGQKAERDMAAVGIAGRRGGVGLVVDLLALVVHNM